MNWSVRYASSKALHKVWSQLEESFPENAMGWIKRAQWFGPVEIPLEIVDFSNEKTWKAYKEQWLVDKKKKKIRKGKGKPVILVDAPKDSKYIIIDGHHRARAYKQLNKPIKAFVGKVSKESGPWDTFHSKQLPKDPESK